MYRADDRPRTIGQIVRHRIRGVIRTDGPLHIGDGERAGVHTRDCEKAFLEGEKPEYATIATDFEGRPVIPATAIKGTLRAWAEAHGIDPELLKRVFGTTEGGGIVTFCDGKLKRFSAPADPRYRLWSASRGTALSPQVAINPRTRSAEEHLLYYVEYVPEGTEFELECVTQGAGDVDRGLLLFVLEHAFKSGVRPCRLGGEMVNGWGRVTWQTTALEYMDPMEWLRGGLQPWHTAFRPEDAAAKSRWVEASRQFKSSTESPTVGFRLTLAFDGAMLVNDPSRCRKGEQPISHAAIRQENGDFVLPAQSVRGAFRAQARRIWQTLAWESGENLNGKVRTGAARKELVPGLAAFLKLFGATGWRAPIEVDDFRLDGLARGHEQEFVAVDRFTGGAADKKKFSAHGLWRPRFTGGFRVRADRLENCGAGPWAWLVLAFTLRDWMEGDGTLGFGASKGYGAFRASVAVEGEGKDAELMRGVLARNPVALRSGELEEWTRSLANALEAKEAA